MDPVICPLISDARGFVYCCQGVPLTKREMEKGRGRTTKCALWTKVSMVEVQTGQLRDDEFCVFLNNLQAQIWVGRETNQATGLLNQIRNLEYRRLAQIGEQTEDENGSLQALPTRGEGQEENTRSE